MRNIIVTGGSRGLGLAIASALASTGDRAIAIARRRGPQLDAAIEQAPQSSIRFRAFDLTDLGGIPKLVKELRKEFGAIYALVNNAGLGASGVLATMADGAIEQLARINVVAPIILTKHVVRAMMIDGGGRIVNVGSIVGATGYPGLSVYSATKAALTGFTRSLARELGALNINVNAVAPGFIDTDMTAELRPQHREQIARRSALRRLAEPSDIAAAVEFLLSEKARNITGIVLTVDAGNTA